MGVACCSRKQQSSSKPRIRPVGRPRFGPFWWKVMREEEMFISQTAPQHMDVDVNVVSLRDDKNVILSAIDLSWLCQLQLNQININTAAIIIHRGTDDDDDNMSFNSLPLTSGSWSQTLKSDRSIHGLPVSGNSGNSAYFSETQNAGESILPEVRRSLVRP